MRWKTEPVLVVAVLQAALALGVAFGLHLTAEQVGGIVALAGAVTALFVRQQVTPVAAKAKAAPATPVAEATEVAPPAEATA